MNFRDIILTAIRQYLDREEMYSVTGVVSEINETARVCTVTPHNDSAPIPNVRLQASNGLNYDNDGNPQTDTAITDGLVFIPVDGSDVVVTFINKDHGYIATTSKVAKVIGKLDDSGTLDIKVKDMELYMDQNGIAFNGGNNNGLVLLSKLVQRMNQYEQILTDIKLAANTHTHSVPALGTSGTPSVPVNDTIPSTTNSDLENTKVKQ